MTQQRRFTVILTAVVLCVVGVLGVVVWTILGALQNPTAQEQNASQEAHAAQNPTPAQATKPAGAKDDPAQAVALEAAQIMTSWDPGTDQSMMDAVRRASHLFTSKLAAQIDYSLPTTDAGVWNQMSDKKAVSISKVTVQEDLHDGEEHRQEHEPEARGNAKSAAVTVLATWSWETEGYRQLHDETRMFFFELTEEPEGRWMVAGYNYQDVPTRYLEVALE